MVNVICMKWGTRYEPAYVNRLRRMVRRHLSLDHRFVCFTDDPGGIDSDIEIKPLPEVQSRPGPERYWNKLGIFTKPLADFTGPVLCFDLDLVIVDNLDCFFEHPGEFCIIREFRRDEGPPRGNMSVCRFEAGAYPHVLEEFQRDPASVEARFTFDQDFISASIKPLTFWPDEWCRSCKKHCLAPVPRCYFTAPRIPPGARIIVFHGHPKPPQAARGCLVRGGIKYCRATPWIAEHSFF
jgi:hypothetical protein